MAPHANDDVVIAGVTDTQAAVIPDPVLTTNPTHTRFTLDDVLPHRQKSAPMPAGVAAFGSADMFKSKGCFLKPQAKDFAYRISPESASRKPSSLKNAMKYFRKDMISLCGGLPSAEYFPFESVSARVPQAPYFAESHLSARGTDVEMHKYDVRDGKGLYDLSIALNYGQSMGPPQLLRYICEHTEIVHDPKYSDWDVVSTVGSTSTLELAMRIFCQRGDFILTEEFSFSSAIESMLPQGVTPIGVAMDGDGMLATSLDEILTNWDETRGRKPFVVYFVPTGQNPSGATQSLQRRKDIYAIAEKHDLILLEDEPYYFLQMDPYVPGKIHTVPQPFTPTTPADFLAALIPSYLSMDTSGRVVRMDSFSKIIAPGSRVGWITAPKQICERFMRAQEVSTQCPAGFSSALLYKLLEETWGHKGFLEWLMFIRAEYTRRRDIICDACERYLPQSVSKWNAPVGGMFHWIEVDPLLHPGVKNGTMKVGDLEEKVFLAGVEANVLVARGSWFLAEKDNEEIIGSAGRPGALYFRMTYAAASEEQIVEAVRRFGEALKAEFGLQ